MTGVLIRRQVDIVDVDTDAHELEARIIAYRRPSRVVDRPENAQSGDWEEYVEEFAPHAFTGQLAARHGWGNVQLVERHHGPGVGYAIGFEDNRRELRGRFRVLPRAWADVSTMIGDGIDAVSAEFVPLATRSGRADGLVLRTRVRAFLERVALEPVGAHPDARVLALRSAGAPSVPTPHRDDLAAYLKEQQP